MKSNRNYIRLLIDIIIIIILIVFDQFTKVLAVNNLKDKPSVELVKGVFELHYLENKGAAFGMLQNQKWLFLVIAILMVLAVVYILFKLPKQKKYFALRIGLLLIASGAVGNMIDRITTTYVVDFLYFVLINFPIFNVADIYVSVACVLIIVLILFVYKDSDFDFLKRQKVTDGDN